MTTGVQFEEENSFRSRTILGQPATPKMVDFLIRNGFVNNYRAAKNLLIISTLVLFALSIFIYVYFVGRQPEHVRDPLYKLTPEQKAQIPADELKVMSNPKWN